jgi:hypothetical protein
VVSTGISCEGKGGRPRTFQRGIMYTRISKLTSPPDRLLLPFAYRVSNMDGVVLDDRETSGGDYNRLCQEVEKLEQ